jgi:hypothetical protein
VTPTLFEWAGGQVAFRRLTDAFYDRVEADELLSPFFPGGVGEEHRAHITACPRDDVAEHAPVSRWGWGAAPPYRP